MPFLLAPPAHMRPLTPAAPVMPEAAVTGAAIDERQARAVIVVTPATVRAGFEKARANLAAGVATKLVLRPGVYRADLSDLVWDTGRARDTLLIVQGTPGRTVWTGADVFPLSTWERTATGLLVHGWPHRFGNRGNFWAPAGNIAHRREMAFVGGTALRPQVLETYKIGGLSYTESKGVTYTYLGRRDPETTLKPGDFGVTERPENGGRVYLRLPEGLTPRENDIELSVRAVLLNFGAKRRLVLRGLDFVRCANPMPSADSVTPGFLNSAPVAFDTAGTEAARDVLVDHCRCLWNSGTGLNLSGSGWTVRDSVFNDNGLSGISTGGDCKNVLFDGDETSFNCWRAWRGGENDWAYGGVKMHGTDLQRVTRHLALGNCSTGLWWDVSCRAVDLSDSVALASANCDVKYEFSYGPFHARRLVLGGSKWGEEYIFTTSGDGLLEDSVLYKDFPMDHKEPASVAGLLSYRRGDEPKAPPIVRGVYGMKGCVVVAGPKTPRLVTAEWWDDPKEDAAWGSGTQMRAALGGNIYWAVGHAPAYDVHLTDTLGVLRSADFTAFRRQSGDAGSREADPKMRDPADYDFRFAQGGPLYARRARWPQYRLPPAKLAEMRAFFAWLGCPPDGPAAPPAGEP